MLLEWGQWYRFEVVVDGVAIAIVRDDRLLESQTSNFAAIQSQLTTLRRAAGLGIGRVK